MGSALRAGLRYAARQGYDVVVRLDADGQHDVDDVERLLAPLLGWERRTSCSDPDSSRPIATAIQVRFSGRSERSCR